MSVSNVTPGVWKKLGEFLIGWLLSARRRRNRLEDEIYRLKDHWQETAEKHSSEISVLKVENTTHRQRIVKLESEVEECKEDRAELHAKHRKCEEITADLTEKVQAMQRKIN